MEEIETKNTKDQWNADFKDVNKNWQAFSQTKEKEREASQINKNQRWTNKRFNRHCKKPKGSLLQVIWATTWAINKETLKEMDVKFQTLPTTKTKP